MMVDNYGKFFDRDGYYDLSDIERCEAIAMIRALMPFCLVALCSTSVAVQAAGAPLATAPAVATAPVNCEKPTDPNMVPAPNSEADIVSQMEAWWAQKEAISQMEAWWAHKEAISQMEAWWRERTKFGSLRARKPVRLVPDRWHRDDSDSPTEFVGPHDPGLGGSIKSINKRELSDDELDAIAIRQR
jgi:hypothetical protein